MAKLLHILKLSLLSSFERLFILAKIITSALIDGITGKLNGSTFKKSKSGTVLIKRSKPSNPRSELQQKTRMFASYFSGHYDSLSLSEKSMWNRFASLSKKKMSGVNAYVSLNMNIICANYSSLVCIDSPPKTPSTPDSLSGFSVNSYNSTSNIIFWQTPSDPLFLVSLYFSVQTGYSNSGKESWQHLSTTPSSSQSYTHNHSFPSGTVFSYRAFSLDFHGRKSPFTPTLKGPYFGVQVDPGLYGYSSYAFAYYSGPGPSIRVLISDVSVGSHSDNVKTSFLLGYGSGISEDQIEVVALNGDAATDYAYNNSIPVHIRSTTGMESFIPNCLLKYPDVQCFIPAGSNSHYQIYDSGGDLPVIVVTGAGDTENETAWDIEFFAPDPLTPEPADASSYSNPYIAGQIMKIMDTLDCTMWEARHRARMTSSRADNWDAVDGFGLIDVSAALVYSGEIPADPYV